MRSIAKPILFLAGGGGLLFGALVLIVNIYLQSGNVQDRMRAAISDAAGVPVKIEHSSFTPWSGFTFSGLSLPPQGQSKVPALSISSLRVRVQLLSLFQREIVVKEVIFLKPVLVSVPTSSGRWPLTKTEIPAAPAPDVISLSVPNVGSVSVSTPVAPTSLVEGASESHSQPLRVLSRPEVQVGAVQVRNGKAVFYDSEGNPFFEFENIFIDSHVASDRSLAGNIRIEKITIAGVFHPAHLRARFDWSGGRLVVSDVVADWADGSVFARFAVNSVSNPTFESWMAVQNVSVKNLSEDAGISGSGKRGKIFANGTMDGTIGVPETFAGSASVSLVDGRLEPLDVIRQIGDLLGVDELKMLELKQADANVTIRDGKVIVDKMSVASNNFIVDATGESGFNGALSLAARFHVNEKIRKESRGLIGGNFEPSEWDGYTHMPFRISGTLARPKTDLLDKLVGTRISQDLGGLINSFLRPIQGQKKKKSSKPAPVVTPEH